MSKPTVNEEVISRLDSLRESYRNRLNAELKELAELLDTPIDSNSDLSILHAHLHKLAGSAGTFGYHQFGLLARQYELIINELQSGDDAINPISIDTSSWLASLHDALDKNATQDAPSGVSILHRHAHMDKPHIVLVERDAMLLEYTAQQLELFGFQVTCLQDADELSQLGSEPPDLLLVDHRAGDLQQLSQQPVAFWQHKLQHIGCPIFFTGGEDGFQARLNAIRSFGSGYFIKPLNIVELTTKIVQVLNTQGAEPERILIVGEQYVADAKGAILERAGMSIFKLNQPANLLNALRDFNPEMILILHYREGVIGTEIGAILEQFERWTFTPVVYSCVNPNVQIRQKAMLLSNFTLIEGAIDDAHLVGLCRARVQKLRQFEASLTQDGLTGLLKHASIKEAVHAQWLYAQRNSSSHFSLVMLDIDHFKRVNDTYGHAAGDSVIAAVGTLLKQFFRRIDKLGRYGGEEFALVLVDCSANDALRKVEELRQMFAKIQFSAKDVEFSCTLSAGIADNATYPNDSPQELLERADKALYCAKQSGRNQVRLAEG